MNELNAEHPQDRLELDHGDCLRRTLPELEIRELKKAKNPNPDLSCISLDGKTGIEVTRITDKAVQKQDGELLKMALQLQSEYRSKKLPPAYVKVYLSPSGHEMLSKKKSRRSKEERRKLKEHLMTLVEGHIRTRRNAFEITEVEPQDNNTLVSDIIVMPMGPDYESEWAINPVQTNCRIDLPSKIRTALENKKGKLAAYKSSHTGKTWLLMVIDFPGILIGEAERQSIKSSPIWSLFDKAFLLYPYEPYPWAIELPLTTSQSGNP